MAELIRKEDTLNQGREKLNEAIKDADKAKNDSAEALDKAEEALGKSESTQTQLDTIVINGDSSVEAAQARVDEKGQTHTTLKERIDDGFTKVSTQLADFEQSIEDRISDLDGLEIKGGFDTLNDLKNAYPNGTTGLFVVQEELYGWNGSQWKIVKELEIMPWADFLTSQDEEWVT